MQEAKEEGIRQGIWLCIQRLVHMEQYDHDGSIQLFYIQGKRVDKAKWEKLHHDS